MKRIYCLILIACILSAGGCLKSKEDNPSAKKIKCSDGRIVDEPLLCIEGKTTTVSITTIPETSSSTTKPYYFETETSTLTKRPTPPRVTTTTLTDPCLNGVLDEGEDLIDCGRTCFCRLLTLLLNGEKQKHPPSGYSFAFNSTIYVNAGECGKGGWPRQASYFSYECKKKKYVVNITLPDGLVDIRYITSGDSYFIDKLEFGILSEYEENITIAVRQDPATLNLSERYEVLSIGGTECGFKETGLCRRKFLGYKFRLLEREKDRVKIEVTTPEKNTLPSTWIYTTPDRIRDLEIGVVRPITLGGYATIYLKEAI